MDHDESGELIEVIQTVGHRNVRPSEPLRTYPGCLRVVVPRLRGRARKSSAGAGSTTAQGSGPDGLCAPAGGGAETESEPASGLEDLARRLRRRHGTRETGESPRGRREETSEASRLGHNSLRWRARPPTANILWWAPLTPRPRDCGPPSSPPHGALPSKGTNWRHLLTGVLADGVFGLWLVVAARCRHGRRQEGFVQSRTGGGRHGAAHQVSNACKYPTLRGAQLRALSATLTGPQGPPKYIRHHTGAQKTQ
ncbi:hypothetical protein NDU88_001209 [Pleurodeles waltl]|uniref:Uncharacterized protein n=1 Tax=Pleurodeles waltl TaxID=8319 RepID=A0AAV7SZG8_PLEWA|nr:hypothetical protein NDU88_001209 [Pleurodeles waltl]